MVDRVQLLREVSSHVHLPAVKAAAYKKALEKALALSVVEMPLAAARSLSAPVKEELATAIDQIFTLPELKNISKKWEPARGVSSGFTQTEIVKALHDLLYERREPYAKPTMKLEDARDLSREDRDRLSDQIDRLMPANDLKALCRKWDAGFQPPQTYTASQFRVRLQELLLTKREPEPKPAPKRKAKSR